MAVQCNTAQIVAAIIPAGVSFGILAYVIWIFRKMKKRDREFDKLDAAARQELALYLKLWHEHKFEKAEQSWQRAEILLDKMKHFIEKGR